MEFIQKITPQNNSATAEHPVKYSEIVRNKTKPGIIIKPKNQEQQNSQTRADLMQQINPLDSAVQISKVKNIKDGGILIGCRNSEENDKFLKIAVEKLSADYEVKEVKGVSPRVRVVGINPEIGENNLLEIITKMNNNLIGPDCKLIKYFPTKKNRNVYQAIIQLDKTSYENVMHAGNLFVGYSSCSVFDAVDIHRCFRCNEFNHLSKYCNKPHTCPKCGDSHEISSCQSKTFKCINCSVLKTKLKSDINVEHAAWEIGKCTAYTVTRDKLRADLLSFHQ